MKGDAAPGGTPILEVGGVWAKLECTNPCGSVKDRIVSYIIREARKRGDLKPGQPIVEATSGNTGIAFAYYARLHGHPVTIVMPEHMTEERKALIRGLGANLVLCSKEGSFAEAAAIRDRIAQETGAYNPDQFSNELNSDCHRQTTGPEIVSHFGSPPNAPAFVAGVGTGGTVMGVGAALRDAWGAVGLFAVEPAEAAVMTGGPNEAHGIFGIGDGFIPALASDGQGGLHPMIDGVEVVTTEEAMQAARTLSSDYGLCVGVSSGANFVAAQRLKARYETVITVFADGHQKYHTAGLAAPAKEQCPFQGSCRENVLAVLLAQIEGDASSSAQR
ncbi:MAG TPA: cysteine synthase family protein [Fimbriimonadaceae bacterium]|nr:cysteine synthase family protein [Fimbriimonadaceae bacterium]HRJ95999.1 cysteine synthase family protein [Fimbriimonadaceae bacterium]